MSEPLSIPFLLKKIQPEAVDRDVLQRCQEAERLSRQRDFDDALALALATIDIAVQSDTTSLGIALLYLAAIRYATPRPGAQFQALEDLKTALVWLKRDQHHLALAHLMRAYLLDRNDQPRAALRHYRDADEIVVRLMTYSRRHNQAGKEKEYSDLHDMIDNAIKQIRPQRAASPADDVVEAETPRPGDSSSSSGSAAAASQSTTAVATNDQYTPQFYDVSRVWINGQEYLVETVQPVSAENPAVRLLPDQKYIAIPIDAEADDAPQRFVLVREQKNLEQTAGDQARQYVVEVGLTGARAWVYESDLNTPYVRLRTLGTDLETETTPKENVSIVGTVEAKLSPVSAEEQMPAPSLEIDEDLLSSIDAFAAARGVSRRPGKGLSAIHSKFLNHLRRRYDLEVIPITPGKTKFDEKLGHYAVATTRNTRLPDGVITAVVHEGYTRQGKIVRDAHVIVNQKKAK